MKEITIGITAASYSGNKGAAAMLQSSIQQLYQKYGHGLNINLMSVYPEEDKKQVPYDFVRVISCKPEQLLFIVFPLAVFYRIFRWCLPFRKLLEKYPVIGAYVSTDFVLDEAGISFVDSRGVVMNTYAFVCAAVPLLLGVPVMKYSQALGSFRNPWNRLLAKWILPKLSLICARGRITSDNLAGIGIRDNVKLCADGAFSMPDDEETTRRIRKEVLEDPFFEGNVTGCSVSSVVQKKCLKKGVDYAAVMIQFIDWLNENGYPVLLIANAARIHSDKIRNNDLMICDEVYSRVKHKEMVRWYHKEMTAEEIREYIGCCRYLVASRFHAMVGALEKKVPVLLIGWSHKYQEVLDMFELSEFATDFSELNFEKLSVAFKAMTENEDIIRERIEMHYDEVMESSKNNIRYVVETADSLQKRSGKKGMLLDFRHPEHYAGEYLCARKGYASDAGIRENAASGGMVTAFLCFMLEKRYIDGAWVTRKSIIDGNLSYETFIATTSEEICSCSSSIYMDMPLLKHIDAVRNFQGRVAVVLTPCMLRGLEMIMQKDRELQEKVVIKLGLYCGGVQDRRGTQFVLEKLGISLENAKMFYYKKGHWRGNSCVIYNDGSEINFSSTKTLSAYKNAYFFQKKACMYCQDHFAREADISFGDIWLREMKKEPVKHTGCVIRRRKVYEWYFEAVAEGILTESHLSGRNLLKGQKRPLVFKYNCAQAKMEQSHKQLNLDTSLGESRWNHRLAYWLSEKDRVFSLEKEQTLRRIPMWLIYYYMCFIRLLLSF